MATKNPRINVTLKKDVVSLLSYFARRKKLHVSELVSDLILDALEHHEDIELSEIARLRDTGRQKTISHKNAWR